MKILLWKLIIISVFFVVKSHAMNEGIIPSEWKVDRIEDIVTFMEISENSPRHSVTISSLPGLALQIKIKGPTVLVLFKQLVEAKIDKRSLHHSSDEFISLCGIFITLDKIPLKDRPQLLETVFAEATKWLPSFSGLVPLLYEDLRSLDNRENKKIVLQKPEEDPERKEAQVPAAVVHNNAPKKLSLQENIPTIKELVGENGYLASRRPYRSLICKNSIVYFVKPFAPKTPTVVIYIKFNQNDLYDYIKITKEQKNSYYNDPKERVPWEMTTIKGSFEIEGKSPKKLFLTQITTDEELLREKLIKLEVPIKAIKKIESTLMMPFYDLL